jgi:hypothetical protein
MTERLTSTEGVLFDGGEFRLYDNRIEIDKHGFFGGVKRVDIVYYSDITSAEVRRKQLFFTRTGVKTNIILQFKKKDQAQQALGIINSHKA